VHYPASDLVIDPVLIRKYDTAGPRYASYPTMDHFVEAFGEADLRQWFARRNIGGITQPLSVYVHLPYCDTGRLARESALLGPLLAAERGICHLHWGAGTAPLPARKEMGALMAALDACIERRPGTECSLQADPRRLAPGTLQFLAGLGFNRVSLGAQDREVETRRVIDEARASGLRSVGVELVYGLPKQTLDGFNAALDKLIALGPDRIALRACAEPAAPTETRLQVLTLAVGRLARAGFLYIGMDQFALPGDDLALCQAQGRLQLDFQGYSKHAESDMIGLGVAALGRVGPVYYQNAQRAEDCGAALDAGRLPVARGIELTPDDLLRRAVIQALMCQFRVSIESIELGHLIDFRKYFAAELADLRRLSDDGLVELDGDWLVVTPKGRLLVRVVSMVFDRYLRERTARASYSKVI
jgi:oxygen-independent coproporphyrinogen III oxidase